MQPADLSLLQGVLEEALDLDPNDRSSYLRQALADRHDLLNTALSLAAHDLSTSGLLPNVASFEGPPRIKGYRMLSLLGEGGMGAVFLAKQENPLVRTVAIKVIRPGMASGEVLARFELERRALASLEHEGIAAIHSTGTTDDGTPYFAMEYVPGIAITTYCDLLRLTLSDRITMFLRVCAAVDHAHRSGVVHRDLKPANILAANVNGEHRTKVIDFGVAKILTSDRGKGDDVTRIGQLIGTPAYMSPEQSRGDNAQIDDRSDVFSLGVVLHELLVGCRPNHPNATDQPIDSRPVTGASSLAWRISTALAAARQLDVDQLAKKLRGDLDWILAKCTETEPGLRYQSIGDLLSDLGCYIEGRPLEGRSSRFGYRAFKSLRRNRWPLTVLVLAVSVVGILSFAEMQRREVSSERERGESAAQRAEAIQLATLGLSLLSTDPTAAAAYALASLGLADTQEARELASRSYWQGPAMYRLPSLGTWNPWAIDFSPDGESLAAGWSREGGAWLFPSNGAKPKELPGHRNHVHQVKFNHRGDLLATSATDSTVLLWSVPDGKLLRRIRPGTNATVYFPTDNERLITCSHALGEMHQWISWPLAGGQPDTLGSWGKVWDRSGKNSPDMDPAGNWVLDWIGSELFLFPTKGDHSPRMVGAHDSTIAAVAFSPTADRVASVDTEGATTVWFLDGTSIVLPPADKRPMDLTFDRSGNRLACASSNGTVARWSLDGPPGSRLPTLRGQSGWKFKVRFHPSGRWVATTGDRGALGLWRTGPPCYTIDHPSLSSGVVKFHPREDGLVVAQANGDVRFWPSNMRGSPRTIIHSAGPRPTSLGMNASGDVVAVSGNDGLLAVASANNPDILFAEGFSGVVWLATVSPTGHRITAHGETAYDEAYGRVWELENGSLRGASIQTYLPVGFTSDDRLLNFHSESRSVVEWDLSNQTHRTVVLDASAPFALSPDRKALFFGLPDGPAVLDLNDHSVRKLPHLVGPVRGAALANDGTILAMLKDRVVVLGRDRLLYEAFGHSGEVHQVDLRADGSAFLTSGADGTIRVWPRARYFDAASASREDLVQGLRRRTNVRVVRDDHEATGYREVSEAFAGWDTNQ